MSPRAALTLTAPGLLVVAPAAAWMAADPASPALAQAASGFPYATLAAVALLAWRFQRSRVVAAAVALAVAVWSARAVGGPLAAHVAAALLPLVLALLAPLADRRLGAPRALAQLALPLGAAGGAALLIRERPALVVEWMGRTLVPALPAHIGGIPQTAFAAALAGLALLAGVALYRRRALEAGLFWCAVAGTAALAADPVGPARGAWTLAAALSLGVALVEAAYALAFRDELTDLPGRRALRSLLGSLRAPYAVAVVDVDRFKAVNDRYGHDVGDQVLCMVAARLGRVGGGGRAFRSGGEEFTLVFPGKTGEEAAPHLEAVRRAVADARFTLRRPLRPAGARGAARRGKGAAAARQLRVTISIGVARAADRAASPDDVVKRADQAMYRAKEGGRNRVCAAADR